FLKSRNLVIKRLPVAAEDVSAGYDHIDLLRSSIYRAANLADPLSQRRQSSRKASGNRCDVDASTFKCMHRCLDEGVIDTHSGDLELKVLQFQVLHDRLLDRLLGLRAETKHALRGVISGQCS